VHEANLISDYNNLGDQLSRRGIEIADILQKAMDFAVAVPSWGAGTGGTRFARFPGISEPRNIFEKLEDCAVVNDLVRITGEVSPLLATKRLRITSIVLNGVKPLDLMF